MGEDLLTPEGLASRLPSRPLLATADGGYRGLTLQHFRHPPSTIEVPGLRDELLVGHLFGPVMVEERLAAGDCERRWTGPGQVSVTPAGQPVHRVLKGWPDVVLLHLAPELLHNVARDLYGQNAGSVELIRCLAVPDLIGDQLVRLLLAEAETPGPGSSLMTESLGQALIVHLLRFHSSLAGSSLVPRAHGPAPRLGHVVEQMRACLDQDMPLSRLAAVAGLSSSQLVRSFREAMGMPPHRFLRGLRIEKARELLEHTELPVIEIALACGFGQPSHFTTTFREATGLSPRAWRQARRS